MNGINSTGILIFIAMFGIFFVITFPILHLAKIAQYKKRLGVKLNFFLVLFQIAKINKWQKTINPRLYPSFETYFQVFAKTDFDGYRIMDANNFALDSYRRIIYVGQVMTFKQFKHNVDVFLNKAVEDFFTPEYLKDLPNFFKNYNLPYNNGIQNPYTNSPKKSDESIYARLRIMALALAYIQVRNNEQEKQNLLKEVKTTYTNYKQYFTKTEKKLFADKLNSNELMSYSWNIEGLYALCYVCDIEKKILLPNSPCTVDLYSKLVQVDPQKLKLNNEKAKDMQNIYHALLWTKRDCKLKHKKIDLDEEIVQERYKALVWLFEDDTPYDEVVCDT